MFKFNTNKLMKMENSCEQLIISNREINCVTTLDKPKSNSVIFINNIDDIEKKLLNDFEQSLIIVNKYFNGLSKISINNDIVISDNPRLMYAKIIKYILEIGKIKTNYKNIGIGTYVGQNSNIEESVTIEPNVTIGKNVSIGNNTIISSGVRIGDNVSIGNNCVVRNNTVIGGCGFGTEIEENGVAYRIPHLGSVKIGDNVDIGALNTIVSGTIHPTIVEDNVMSDDHVHIAHNCYIGEASMITACVEISGSVTIGKRVYIGPNSTVINKIQIGDNVYVGIGSLVNKNILSKSKIAGIPAKNIEDLIFERKKIKELIKKNKY